jgi:DNA-binding response OmpR family regulator
MDRVLLVEDDPLIVEFTAKNLIKDGFQVMVATTGEEALQLMAVEKPDIILLDIMLPHMDGYELCRHIRQGRAEGALAVAADIPIVILTARVEDADKLRGFEVGVDDYVTKPFNPLELAARLKAVLRRAGNQDSSQKSIVKLGPLTINVLERTVYLNRMPFQLPPKEFDLLVLLARHPNRVFSREELLKEIWGYTFGNTRTVDEHVKRLRHRLKENGLSADWIVTVWGVGYKLQPENAEP